MNLYLQIKIQIIIYYYSFYILFLPSTICKQHGTGLMFLKQQNISDSVIKIF